MACYVEHSLKLHVYFPLSSGNSVYSSVSVAVGPVVPPVASGANLASAPFKQCGGAPTIDGWGFAVKMTCNPGTSGRYMYVYNNVQTPTSLRVCDVHIAGTGRY